MQRVDGFGKLCLGGALILELSPQRAEAVPLIVRKGAEQAFGSPGLEFSYGSGVGFGSG